MIRYGKKTKESSTAVLDKAIQFFGPKGEGLDVKRRTPASVLFEGGGGHVLVSVDTQVEGETEVDVESREWDYQAKQFLGKI